MGIRDVVKWAFCIECMQEASLVLMQNVKLFGVLMTVINVFRVIPYEYYFLCSL